MNTRQVLFVALVAMVVAPAFGHDALVFGALKTAADKHSATTVALSNPSQPPTGESKTLLYGTTMDVNIKKVPLVTVSNAPCKQICKNVCKVELTKSCSTVPVVSKVCTPTKKTLSKQICSKKCKLTVETPKPNPSTPPTDDTPSYPNPSTPSYPNPSTPSYPNPSTPSYPNPSTPPTDDTPSYPNPSTPGYPKPSTPTTTAASTGSTATLSFHKDASLSAGGITADLLAAKGRRLSGLLAAKVAGAALAADVAGKTIMGAERIKYLPVPACDDVCETVAFEVPDVECHEVTHETEICKMVPSNNCYQECVCIPQKTFALNLPKKTVDISKP